MQSSLVSQLSTRTPISAKGVSCLGRRLRLSGYDLENCSTKEVQDILLSYSAEIQQFGVDPGSSFFPIDPIAAKSPTRILVESSAISSISYDPKSQTLDVE